MLANTFMIRGIASSVGKSIHRLTRVESRNGTAPFKVIETSGKADYLDGAMNSNGLILGSYIHGLFHNAEFTRALLNRVRDHRGLPQINSSSIDKQQQYGRLAEIVRQNLDMPRIYQITLGRSR